MNCLNLNKKKSNKGVMVLKVVFIILTNVYIPVYVHLAIKSVGYDNGEGDPHILARHIQY